MLSEDFKAKVSRFNSDRLAKWSLITLLILFALSLPAELWCNSRPILIVHDGNWYFPALFTYTARDFGGHSPIEPDYRSTAFAELIGIKPLADTTQSDAAAGGDTSSPREILALFDESGNGAGETVQHGGPTEESLFDIVDKFDSGPNTVSLDTVKQRLGYGADRGDGGKAFVIWPPVQYDYAYISRRSQGRDALASPWSQAIPGMKGRQPSAWQEGHYLGTDNRGRDVLARLVYGFRISLVFGLALAVTSTLVGTMIGAVQGFFGGVIDLLGQRVVEMWSSLPELYLLIILSSMLARNILVLFLILNLTAWIGIAAYMRAEFLRNRNQEYVKAARALGVGSPAIMARHVLPNSLTPIITFFPFSVTGGILALVSLDFLGLGVPSPYPSLGEMLRQGQSNLHAVWIFLPTFVVLSGTMTLLTFIGDGVRKAFDPRHAVRRSGKNVTAGSY